MQIAMTAPHQTVAFARDQQRAGLVERQARRFGQRFRRRRRKQIVRRDQILFVLRRNLAQRVGKARIPRHRRILMRVLDDAAERVGQCVVDLAGRNEMIERLAVVEARHVDRPFHRLALAADREAIALTRNGDHAAIDSRRIGAVDLELGLAGRFAPFQRGKIQERKLHRAFDLERARACQKTGRMGIDAPYARAAMRRGR